MQAYQYKAYASVLQDALNYLLAMLWKARPFYDSLCGLFHHKAQQ